MLTLLMTAPWLAEHLLAVTVAVTVAVAATATATTSPASTAVLPLFPLSWIFVCH